jgi:pimeloyl-ACP methyl ester carboxylesterase
MRAVQRFPLFLVRWLLLDKFESWRYAPHVSAPTLLLAAEHDDLIPRASTELLYKHLPKPIATLIVIPNAGP